MVFVVRSSVAGTLSLVATVPDGGIDIDPGNNVEPETTTILAGSDMAISLSVPATAASGSVVNVDIEATNNGPDIVNNFEVSFPIPTGLVNVTPPPGCTLSASTYTCVVSGPLAVGGSVSLPFTGQISAAGGSMVTATSSVLNSDPTDPISSNNTDLGNITVTSGTDVSIDKTRSPSGTLLVGDAVSFTLSAQYTGDSPSDLEITDTIPADYQIDSITAPGWTCTVAGQDVSCERPSGTVAGANISLGSVVIDTTVISAGTPLNTAMIGSSGPVDSDLTNNTATDGGATIEEPVVDLRANKSGPSPALAVVGNSYSYSISTSNIGNADFFGTIEMVDTVPAGMTVDSAALNGWSCATVPATGLVDVTCSRVYTSGAPLTAGSTTPSVGFSTTITSAGVISNGLAISSPDANIPDVLNGNDTITYDVTASSGVNSADISADKTALVDPVAAGEVQTFELEIVNPDLATSEDVLVIDNLTNLINSSVGATGAGYISHSINAGVATGMTCSTVVTGGTSRRLSCDISTLPTCVAGVDCPAITVLVRPGGNIIKRHRQNH